MTPNSFFGPKIGQSLLLPGQSEIYRGQCVQSVGLWVQALGLTFPTYSSAYLYFVNGIPGYTKIPAGTPIKEADIIVWRKDFPPAIFTNPDGSKSYNGHIDVASADGSLGSFSAYDQNWKPLVVAHIQHNDNNNNYIAGYLRRIDMLTPAEVNQLTQIAFNRPAHEDEKSVYSTIPTDEALQRILDGEENIQLRTDAQAYRDGNTVAYIPYTGSQLFVKK